MSAPQEVQEPQVRADFRTIFGLAWPALVVLAATPLYLLFDTAIVGRLGANDLAALAAGATVLGTVTTQLTFLSYGTTARSARLFGANRRSDAIYEGVQATWVAVVVGMILAVLVFTFSPQIMLALTGGGHVAIAATQWMRVTCLSIIPALVTMAGNGWLRGLSNTRLPLYFTLAGVIPMAVSVPFAVRRWGLIGSAIANVFGELIIATGFVLALITCWRRFGDDRSMRPRWGIIGPQLVMGRDLIARSLSFQVAFLSAAGVAGRMGAPALAAHQVLLQLWNFLTLALDSFAIAAQALVGAALGATQLVKARAVARRVLNFSVAASGLVAVVFLLGAHVIPRLFTPDEAVLDEIAGPWWILIGLIVMGGVVFALDGVLLGAADVSFLRNSTIVSVVIGFIPMVWLALVFDLGLTGVWWGLAAFMFIRLVAVVVRYRRNSWHSNSAVST